MTWFADLEPCDYFGEPNQVRAVGWLERGREFPIGSTPRDVFDRLKQLFIDPFQPAVCLGSHNCDLCQYDGAMGSANLWIPGDGCLYVCPQLIIHYIGAHSYLPPAEFQQAVLRCPDTRSMQYKLEFLKNGGRKLITAG